MASDPHNWPEDYLDAHERHWEDAELLFRQQRLANADHLYGLSAECGLKALWLVFVDTEVPASARVHLNHLWPRFVRGVRNRRLSPGIPRQNPFADWRISQRYASRTHVAPQIVESHREGAQGVRNLIREHRRRIL
jgi:hypothetical protein